MTVSADRADRAGSRGEPWLVVIDLQHVFADADSPWHVPDFPAVVDRLGGLVAQHPGRVVLTRFVPPVAPQGSWTDYYRTWPFALDPAHEALWRLVPEVTALLPDVPVVTRPTMGKWGEELLAVTGGARHLVLCGVATDCCILSTALAAADAGAWVRVESTACAGGTAADHERALAAMAAYGPQVEVV